ncbi:MULTISPECIES: thioesterase II family protein [Streptomyces]|uniref:Thioesterase II family protein n=1 Tax=Streptomyces flavovirens TaxID=52258 RepID=A0ABV8NC45_9ACTN|nr:alpha/beta fold hydrolase [Streptomyces sp. MBT51]MBK3591417.1 thioesterase [Streptomyces sp. MBT51]
MTAPHHPSPTDSTEPAEATASTVRPADGRLPAPAEPVPHGARTAAVPGRTRQTAPERAGPRRVVLDRRPDATTRLYCVPPAGMGPECYHRWARLLPAWIEPCTVSLPGRGARAGEVSLTDPEEVSALLAAVFDDPADARPFAVFGHSAGALLAYEAVRRLRRTQGRLPGLLAVSSLPAPHRGAYLLNLVPRLAAGLDGLRELLGPLPRRVIEDPRLMASVCTPLLADCLLLLHHRHREEPPLDVPFALYGGDRDPVVDPEELTAWNDLVTVPGPLRLMPGDHGYPRLSARALITDLTETLRVHAHPEVPR